MKTILILLLNIPFTYVLSLLWVRLWIYHGFTAPPDFLKTLMPADGEGVYNRVELEMFIVLLIVTTFAILVYRFK